MKLSIALLLLFLVPQTSGLSQVIDEPNIFRLAQTYEQAGKYEEALRYYQDLYRYRPTQSGYFDALRRCLTALKRYEDLIDLINEKLKQSPDAPSLLVMRGAARYQAGDEAGALKDWDAAIKATPYDSQLYISIADEAVNLRVYEKAVEYLERGRKTLKSPNLFVFEMARAYAMNMKFDASMKEYVRFLLTQPGAIWQIQQYVAQFTDIPEALASAKKIAKETADDHPSNVAVRQLLAWLFMEEKNYSAAYGVYREIDRLQRSNGIELFQFAQRAFNDKAFETAVTAYRDLIKEFPNAQWLPEAELFHARSVEALSDRQALPDALIPEMRTTEFPSTEAVSAYRGAIAFYETVMQKYPTHPVAAESAYRIAYLKYKRFNDSDGALDILRQKGDMFKRLLGRMDGEILIGDIHEAKGDLDRALEQYQIVLAGQGLTPQQRDEVQYKIAEIYYFKGDFQKATELLEPLGANSSADITNDALDLMLFIQQYSVPSDIPLKRYAQAMFLQRQRKASEAAAQLQDIIHTFPSAPLLDQTYLTLGRLLGQSGQTQEAIRTFDEFLVKYHDSVLKDQVLYALGRVYEEQLQDVQKALEIYQRLLKELPNSIYSNRARERILELRKAHS